MMPPHLSAFRVPFSSSGRSVSEELHGPQRISGERCVPDSGGSASQWSQSTADVEEQLVDQPGCQKKRVAVRSSSTKCPPCWLHKPHPTIVQG
ncbi:hypothetical protein NDU88_005985 [Pleurodeles waltl]|uniref:Uncharacterized protein n=1 Tax=Pleurodeles waltl TaxID=8319 RepID=A0AAV7ML14_PLEWA|nr:hypothetical protein NDU88_005985 [Pleurodeles waltl]